MKLNQIYRWLIETDPQRLEELWMTADTLRQRNAGQDVHLRGLIEISNHCVRHCAYCGLGEEHQSITRYRLGAEQIMNCVYRAVELGYGTVVLQSGEDPGLRAEWIAGLIRRIKDSTPLAVTLSLGERREEELVVWRQAGADRYLLRFETSNQTLYQRYHPSLPPRPSDRLAILHTLRWLGYEIGSGMLIGLPGQTYQDLANDMLLFSELDLDMIGLGPYILHPQTLLGRSYRKYLAAADTQVPNTDQMTYKVLALTRMVCPQANIPATTAIATLDQQAGYELALARGANVVMPNLTPLPYRSYYQIYPNKAGVAQSKDYHRKLKDRIIALGRTIGTGRGDSPRLLAAMEAGKEF